MTAKKTTGIVTLLCALAACGGGGETADQGADAGAKSAPDSAVAAAPSAAAPATGAVVQTQETNASGVVAELTEATREEGVLTVKVRFRNTGTEDASHRFEVYDDDYTAFYVTAADQKYFVLKDSEGAPLTPQYLDVSLTAGQTMTWWAKFPAPPATETTFDLIIPDVIPFEDVPITDQ